MVIDNESKYNGKPDNNAEYNENGPPEHLWAGIAQNTDRNRLNTLREGEEMLTNLNQDYINDNNALLTNVSSSTNILQRYESACNTDVLLPEEYRKMMRQLNKKQKQIVMYMYHRCWCKDAIVCLKHGENVKPYQIFLSGPGGVGKSHVIKLVQSRAYNMPLVQSDTIKLLKLSGMFESDDAIVLLTAPSGVAAFNINGMIIHSALLLGCNRYTGFQPLSNDGLTTLRCKLTKLMLIITF